MFKSFTSGFARAALLIGFATQAHASGYAEVYSCSFTEPFVSLEYDSSKGTLATITPDDYVELPDGSSKANPVVTEGVSLRVTATGKFELVDNAGVVLYELELTNAGSDGMSDTVYPFDIKAKSSQLMPPDYLGGCSSTSLKSTNPNP